MVGDTTVMRYSAEGALLSTDHVACTGCYSVDSIDIDVLPDGSATIVGETGSSPATFLARFGADGQRLLWMVPTDAGITYGHAFHDAAGAIYVKAAYENPTVRRVDPATGAVIWTRSASDFIPLDDGGLLVYTAADFPFEQGISVQAVDRNAEYRWSRTLSSNDRTRISRGLLVDGTVHLLMQDSTPSPSPCATYPHLVLLDAKGSLFAMPPECRTAVGPALLSEFDAKATTGVLANLRYALQAMSPDGNVLWSARSCDWCTSFGTGETQWGRAILAADGGAWAIERIRYTVGLPDGETRLKRIDSQGVEQLSVFAAAQNADVTETRLLESSGDLIALLPIYYGGGVTWQRIRADGSSFPTHNYSIPDFQTFRMTDARLLADGGVMLVTKGDYSCNVGCSPHWVTILRLDAQGGLRWRYQFPEAGAAIALAEDGSATAAVWTYPVGLVLRSIDTQGHPSDTPLAEVTFANPYTLTGPIHGHWLLRSWDSPGHVLWLVDAAGHVAATRDMSDSDPSVYAATDSGYLVGHLGSAELLDVDTLATRAYFSLADVANLSLYDNLPWSLLEDGLVYASVPTYSEAIPYRIGIARFALPGSAGQDLLFRNGFD